MAENYLHIDKWYLDFIGENGETMIFYAANLSWHGITVPYTSWIRFQPHSGLHRKTRFHHVTMPELNSDKIKWKDLKNHVSGTWNLDGTPLFSRLYESSSGYLDWNCLQPRSQVYLEINGRGMSGMGYAEQLISTVPPWKIPIQELRWGRFGSRDAYAVWIEIKGEEKLQWTYLNGKRIDKAKVNENQISFPKKSVIINLDRSESLESEKTIFKVAEKLVKYIPGFNKVIPVHFLMADNNKWLSNAQLRTLEGKIIDGVAIHELVDFKLNKE